MDEVVTEFSMEKLMTMPKGAWREFDSPMKDRTGRIKIAITDAFCISETTVVTDTDTAPWMHYNDTSSVEMNFMLEGHILQTHEGLLDRYHYRKGHHNILFNPYSMETNQLLSTGTHRIFSVNILPEKMIELFAGIGAAKGSDDHGEHLQHLRLHVVRIHLPGRPDPRGQPLLPKSASATADTAFLGKGEVGIYRVIRDGRANLNSGSGLANKRSIGK